MIKTGLHWWKPEQELVCLMVWDQKTQTMETLFEPLEDEIKALCSKYALDSNRLLEVIRNKEAFVHTLMIDLEVYRESLGEDVN